MNYKIGETYDFGGELRRVIGFDGANNPITEAGKGEKRAEKAPPAFDAEAETARLEAEYAIKLDAEARKIREDCTAKANAKAEAKVKPVAGAGNSTNTAASAKSE